MADYQSKFTGEEIDDILSKAKNGGSGGEAVSEVFWVTADLDPNTLSASNVSHTYDEIIQASSEGKIVKIKGFISGLQQEYAIGEASYIGALSGYILFAVFLRLNFGGSIHLVYVNMRLDRDNAIIVEPCIVNTTNIGG